MTATPEEGKERVTDKQNPEEGPRSFTRAVEMLADGDAAHHLSKELFELLNRLRAEARARKTAVTGELTLNLKLKVDEDDTVTVAYASKVKEPPRRAQRSILWLSRGGNLTPENPRQQKLNLREVKGKTEIRDVDDANVVRSV